MIFHTLLYMHLRAAKNALRALLVVAACTIVANAAQPSSVSTPLIQPSIVQPAGVPDERAVISLLSDVISWYRRGDVESQLVTSPAESLFLFENRQLASDIVKDAFQYARARAAAIPRGSRDANATGLLGRPDVIAARRGELNQELQQAEQRLKALLAQFNAAPRARRDAIAPQIAGAQSQYNLVRSWSNYLAEMSQFESSSTADNHTNPLLAQIDELERTVAPADQTKQQVGAAPAIQQDHLVEPSGIFSVSSYVLTLQNKSVTLKERAANTIQFASLFEKASSSLHNQLVELDREASNLASQSGAGVDVATVEQRRKEFEAVIARRKQIGEAILPLRKAEALAHRYVSNLDQWRKTVDREARSAFNRLLTRVVVLALAIGLIVAIAIAWRRLTYHYFEDVRRRRQILKIRNITIGAMLVFVVTVNFLSELGSLATVIGFAAAGIAVALQDVILSVAAYFRVSGRYGIKVGDRVELQGIAGEVVDVSLTKIALMELGDSVGDHGPTGRLVVIPNSSVFREKFATHAPGTTIMWDEIKLTLAPDCDYRLAEKRLVEVVEEVFARYRENARRQYYEMERRLNIRLDPPKPQSRLRVSAAGVEITVRYPVDIRNRAQVADEISRRLIDAFERETKLRLVAQTPPNIQAVHESAQDGAYAHPGNSTENAAMAEAEGHPPHAAAPAKS